MEKGDKTYTLAEIARKICDSYEECTEDCPGWGNCDKGHNGILGWLRDVVEE